MSAVLEMEGDREFGTGDEEFEEAKPRHIYSYLYLYKVVTTMSPMIEYDIYIYA